MGTLTRRRGDAEEDAEKQPSQQGMNAETAEIPRHRFSVLGSPERTIGILTRFSPQTDRSGPMAA
jgi:hypothetical protein